MSIFTPERSRSTETVHTPSPSVAKETLKRLILPPIETPAFDRVPLKAVTEVEHVRNPFTQLAKAAGLHDTLPTDDVTATLDPLIDSSSHELVTQLAELERRRQLPAGEPDRINDNSGGVFLGPREVIASFRAFDAHPSEQTQVLVDFTISHTANKDQKAAFRKAKLHANEQGLPLMEALEVVGAQAPTFEPARIAEGYDWLYSDKVA